MSVAAASRAIPSARLFAGLLRACLIGSAASLAAALLAVELTRTPPSLAFAFGGGLSLVLVLALALWRYQAAVALGLVLLGIVKIEPAPSDAVFLVAIAVALALGTFALERVPLLVTFLVGAYLALNLLLITDAVDTSRAIRFSFITFYLALFSIWLASWVRTTARARLVARAYVFAAVSSALLAIAAMLAPIPGHATLTVYSGTRAVGLFKDPNVFGAFLVPAALIVVDETLRPRLLRGRRATKIAMFFVLALGTVLSFSRAAWVSLGLGIVVMIWVLALRRGGGRRALALIGVIVAAGSIAATTLAVTGSIGFLEQRARLQSYDTQRFAAQAEGIKLVQQHPFGIGPGQFEVYWPLAAHSAYVRALAELGVLGLVIVLGFVVATLVLAGRNAVLGRETYGIGSAALLATWCGLLVSGFVIDTLHWRHLWLVAALIWAGAMRSR